MAKVKGEDVVLTFSDDLFPFICARSIQFHINRDLIETSVTGTGMYKTFTIGAMSWAGTLEGLAVIANGTIEGTMENLYTRFIGGNDFLLTWYEKDVSNTFYLQKQGFCYINSISEVASFDNMVTFNASFTGTGPITIKSGNV